ncbi:NAD(P)/FAD-dependent oxidoreductase [Bacteroidia bacterium]|nr:NAD(P)/FAD-dependent oxidoreductase [Bacteroidia bacterium]MDB9882210.1 NAD(P)/FAD-dependent oxidoreductase [Bacteroidia bacterium]
MIETDIIIIGAGPTGLFAIFEAGLLKLKCHLMDYLPQPGGQLAEIYPKKPIYDIPGFPSILAGELIDNLMEQAKPFNPGFTLGERAESIEKTDDDSFIVTTDRGTQHKAKNVMIAGGLGCFAPRKPELENLVKFEDKGVDYIIKDPEKFRDKKIVIAGGGDSALDWAIFLADVASEVTLVHRRKSFRGALDSVEKVENLDKSGKIKLITEAQISALDGGDELSKVTVTENSGELHEIDTDNFIPLFGLSPKLGPIKEWGLDLGKEAILVNTVDYSTNVPGIFAIGDINQYEGKLKLILCGFHEATIATQACYRRIFPDKKLVLKYTTVMGAPGS